MSKEIEKTATALAESEFIICQPGFIEKLKKDLESSSEKGISSLLSKIVWPSGSSKFFMVPSKEGDLPETEIIGIIASSRHHRTYYKTAYEKKGDGNKPPDCTSNDMHSGEGEVDGAPAGLCEDWGDIFGQILA